MYVARWVIGPKLTADGTKECSHGNTNRTEIGFRRFVCGETGFRVENKSTTRQRNRFWTLQRAKIEDCIAPVHIRL